MQAWLGLVLPLLPCVCQPQDIHWYPMCTMTFVAGTHIWKPTCNRKNCDFQYWAIIFHDLPCWSWGVYPLGLYPNVHGVLLFPWPVCQPSSLRLSLNFSNVIGKVSAMCWGLERRPETSEPSWSECKRSFSSLAETVCSTTWTTAAPHKSEKP